MLPFIQNSAFYRLLSTFLLYLFFTSDAASVPLSFRMFEHFCSLPLGVNVVQLLFYYYYRRNINNNVLSLSDVRCSVFLPDIT